MKSLDLSEAAVEAERDTMIARARAAAAGPGVQPTGECRFCGDLIAHPKIFCNAACLSAWQKLPLHNR